MKVSISIMWKDIVAISFLVAVWSAPEIINAIAGLIKS
jgi:hypothetical protein